MTARPSVELLDTAARKRLSATAIRGASGFCQTSFVACAGCQFKVLDRCRDSPSSICGEDQVVNRDAG